MSTEGKVIECRAAVIWELNGELKIEKVKIDTPKKDEVRIKLASTGICHSDVNMINGADPVITFPCVLGHEGAGIVESLGPGVTDLKIGDHVVPLFMASCDQCKVCKHPKDNICGFGLEERFKAKMYDGTTRITCKGIPIYQCHGIGTYSEYIVAHKYCVAKINPKAPLKESCLIGCCVPTGYGSAVNSAKVRPGSTCAVWGLGGVGVNVLQGCKERGATRIIGIDINPKKFEFAKKFGCTEFINPNDYKEPIEDILTRITDGGVDYALVSVGHPPSMVSAFKACRPGGKAIAIGVTHYEDVLTIPARDLLMARTFKGNLFGDYKGRQGVQELANKFAENKYPVDKLVTHRFKLENIQQAFDVMKAGESIRSIIEY